jgi:hypothetical protein
MFTLNFMNNEQYAKSLYKYTKILLQFLPMCIHASLIIKYNNNWHLSILIFFW